MKIGIIGSGKLGKSFGSLCGDVIYSNEYDNIDVIKNSEVIFCFVDTPILMSNIYDIKNVMDVVNDFGVCFEDEIPLQDKILVICSNINPGTTKQVMEILSPFNMDVCYCPMFVSEGNELNDLRHQQNIIVGSLNPRVVDVITKIYQKFLLVNPNVISMTSKAAEITKLTISSYLATKINFANMVGELMIESGMENELSLVLKAIGDDNRIGSKYLKYGVGYGGPSLPSDNRVLGDYCNGLKMNFILPYVQDDFNTHHSEFLKKYYMSLNHDKLVPFILNRVSYKDDVDNLTESGKLRLMYDLLYEGYTVFVKESDVTLKNTKLMGELVNDFGNRIKFFKLGSSPNGVNINL